ncbi:hypothetical protein [Kribbella sp. NPDC006257]|uniref:hypothetical protein n=1 Tax=Kribbella sp. NPDC006257 TaxID=3156738 RepID=UPI0033BA8D03
MNKLLIPLTAAAVALLPACGSTPESGTPAPTASAVSKPTPTPAPVVLTRADIGQKVQAALKKQGTYRMRLTDPSDKSFLVTATVKYNGAKQDFSISSDDGSVVGVAGQYYYQDGPLNSDSTEWKKYNPKAKGLDALTSALIKAYLVQVQTPRLLAGAPYATRFVTTSGPVVDRVPTTKYAMVLDVKKAVAAKAFGDYLTGEIPEDEKLLPVTAVVDRDGLLRQLDYGVGSDRSSIAFSNFGDSVFISEPAPDQIKR